MWYTIYMNKKVVKKIGRKRGAKKMMARKKSAKVATMKKDAGVPVGFTIIKSDQLPTYATAYDRRNGREILMHSKKYIPKWVKRSLTDEEVSRMLLKNGSKK